MPEGRPRTVRAKSVPTSPGPADSGASTDAATDASQRAAAAAQAIADASVELAHLSGPAAELATLSAGAELTASGSFDPERTRVDAVRLRAALLAKAAEIKAVSERLRLALEQ